jgi:hypothetical protein
MLQPGSVALFLNLQELHEKLWAPARVLPR